MDITFRKATREDVQLAVPLIRSSGPDAFDYIFLEHSKGNSLDFLHAAFVKRGGEFGYDNHLVAEVNGNVVGIGAGWPGTKSIGFALRAGIKILRFYGLLAGIRVIIRGLRFENMVRPPRRNGFVIAHLGVVESMRGKGIGGRLIEQLIEQSKTMDVEQIVLDVSDINPRAKALYERMGFESVLHTESNLQRQSESINVPGHTRMVLKAGWNAASQKR